VKAFPRSPGRGFTLIEVLVAMMIMAILAVMAWQGVDGIVRTRAISQERMEKLLRVNTVLAQFKLDLEATQDSGVLPSVPTFDGISMRLTRRAPEGLQIVVWSLRGGTWLRWAGPPITTKRALLEGWSNTQQFIGNEAGQLSTLTGVSEWQAYCFRGNAWGNCQSSAGTVAEPAPPASGVQQSNTEALKAVRVVLSFGEGSGLSGNLTREIALSPQ
jgi:general secretion pathway protein J